MDITSYLLGKQAGGGGTLQDKSVTITANKTTNITADEGYDGLNSVAVTTDVPTAVGDYFYTTTTGGGNYTSGANKLIRKLPPITISGGGYRTFYYCSSLETPPQITFTGVNTDMRDMFAYCENIDNIDVSQYDVSQVGQFGGCFQHCYSLQSIDLSSWNIQQNAANIGYLFYRSRGLKTIKMPQDLSKVGSVQNAFNDCTALENLTFGSNLGQSFSTSQLAQSSLYTIDLSRSLSLTHDSLMSVINGIYDIASIGVQTQRLILNATNLAKLTADEIAIATNKGWTVS